MGTRDIHWPRFECCYQRKEWYLVCWRCCNNRDQLCSRRSLKDIFFRIWRYDPMNRLSICFRSSMWCYLPFDQLSCSHSNSNLLRLCSIPQGIFPRIFSLWDHHNDLKCMMIDIRWLLDRHTLLYKQTSIYCSTEKFQIHSLTHKGWFSSKLWSVLCRHSYKLPLNPTNRHHTWPRTMSLEQNLWCMSIGRLLWYFTQMYLMYMVPHRFPPHLHNNRMDKT